MPPDRRLKKTDDFGAYDTALTELPATTAIYDAREDLRELQSTATQDRIKETQKHLGAASDLTNQQAAQDMAALGTASGNRQALYEQDIASAESQGALREQYSLEGESALRTARDNQLAGYDLELNSLGGKTGLLGARYEKGKADQRQSAYNAALGSMYSGGTAAGLAQGADQSLADAAGRSSSLLDTEFSQADSDLSTQIQKTELGRESTSEEYGHRLTMAGMQRDMDIDKVRQQVDRLRTQSGADRDENEYRQARAELSLQLENEMTRNNLAIQDLSLSLSEAQELPESISILNEQTVRLAQNAAHWNESIRSGGN